MGKVLAICTSDVRGTQKQPRQSAYFAVDWGIQGDAHAGNWHRQVSLLSADKIAAFNKRGAGVEPGAISVRDEMTIEPRTAPRPWQAAVVTLSDKGAAGEREDKSGPAIASRLRSSGYEVVEQILIADDPELLKRHLIRLADQRQLDLILTTGGTGFAPRDTTPEATLAVAHRNAPGIAEAIRAASMAVTPRAMLSRGVSIIRGKTLIVNLPGSPKACMESMDAFLDAIPHGLSLLRGTVGDCARV